MPRNNPFGADPVAFFGTAAGPNASDLYGPPNGVLDSYVDGTPMAVAQATADSSLPSGGLLQRRDVHALIAMVIGGAMIYAATR